MWLLTKRMLYYIIPHIGIPRRECERETQQGGDDVITQSAQDTAKSLQQQGCRKKRSLTRRNWSRNEFSLVIFMNFGETWFLERRGKRWDTDFVSGIIQREKF